jgi:hypothetical protein
MTIINVFQSHDQIVLIIVNINKDENKSLISNQFCLKNDSPHFLENYFVQSSDMIDLPSNNVHSVRKDDFELDRNINQIDQKEA